MYLVFVEFSSFEVVFDAIWLLCILVSILPTMRLLLFDVFLRFCTFAVCDNDND